MVLLMKRDYQTLAGNGFQMLPLMQLHVAVHFSLPFRIENYNPDKKNVFSEIGIQF